MGRQGQERAGDGGPRLNPVQYVKLDQPRSNFPWAISECGVISQARFESEAAAQIAYRNHTLGRKGA